MKPRHLLWLLVFATLPAPAQNPAPTHRTGESGKAWTTPRTADGHPDLQGIWTNATLTPLQRPKEFASKPFFTEQEAAAFERQRIEQGDADNPANRRAGDVGSYNAAFFDRGSHVEPSRRTSLLIDPADGRFPPFTPQAQARFEQTAAELARHPADGPEDRDLSERCLMFSGVGPPMLPEPYNNNYQIVQTPGYVSILAEMNHDARVIPTDGSAHPPASVAQWQGDSRGHWEGDTLVVDTTNFKFNKRSHFGVAYAGGMSDANLHVIERFTRNGPGTILYRATVEDPGVYSQPWTLEETFFSAKGPVFEYACHEGNYGLPGILRGERAKEAAAR